MLDALTELGCKTELSQAELFMGALTRGDRQAAMKICDANADILGQLHPKDLEIPNALAIRSDTRDALGLMWALILTRWMMVLACPRYIVPPGMGRPQIWSSFSH